VLRFESLEDRRLLAITVNTLVDEADGSIVDGDVSLRDALAAAHAGETIDFDASLDGGTILLTMGELVVTKSLTIDATTLPSGLTIDASGNDGTPAEDDGDGSRVFNIDDGDDETDSPVTIGGLTLIGGDVSENGGAISTRENLTVTDSTISGNSAAVWGGGISGETVTITDSTISENSADSDGGGIHARTVAVTGSMITGNSATGDGGGVRALRDVTVTNSTISANSANGDFSGGGIFAFEGVTLTKSTISGNSATRRGGGIWGRRVTVISSTISDNSASSRGGGIGVFYGTVTVTSSTISGNTARGDGGGVYVQSYYANSTLMLANATISGNTAGGRGGGIRMNAGSFSMDHSLVAGNADGGMAPDIYSGTSTLAVRYSLIGNNTGTGLAEAPVGMPDANGNLVGDPNGVGIVDPLLGPLADNGGRTQTHALMAGSPAVNAGDPDAMAGIGDVPLFDQRGAPFVRVFDGRIDMGAHERQGPSAEIVEVPTPSIVPLDEVAIQFSSEVAGFDTGDLELSLNGGPDLLTESQTLITTDNRTFVLGGLADVTTGSGYYTLSLFSAGSDIADTTGAPLEIGDTIHWVMGRLVLGLTVDTLIDEADGNIDDGDVSLRDALAAAAPGETIDFDASLDGGTILLTMGELAVTRAMAIDASTLTDGLTIDASGNDPTSDQDNGDGSRLFNIDDGNGSRVLEVAIRGLTLAGGDVSGDGGAILTRENLTVTNSTISGNSAGGNGGGILDSGSLTVTNSTILGNSAERNGGGISGGTVTATSSTISENSAGFRDGGGIFAFESVTVTNSTISGNSAERNGGGISGSRITIESSIVAGNTDDGSAPDLRRDTRGRLTVRYSLIGNNTGTGLAEAPVGMPDANGNLIGGPTGGIIDPLLGPLADNGGPTETHALLLGSPAINAGDPGFASPPEFDQRGAPFARVFGGRIDMGAYERQIGDMNFDGDIDYDDIVALVFGLTEPNNYEVLYRAPPNANGDTDTDGDFDFDDIPGFVDLLSSGLAASTRSTQTSSLSMFGIANDHAEDDRVDMKPSTESRREVASGEHLAGPRLRALDPFVKTRTRAPRPWSSMATTSRNRELRDDELATVWSERFDWLRNRRTESTDGQLS